MAVVPVLRVLELVYFSAGVGSRTWVVILFVFYELYCFYNYFFWICRLSKLKPSVSFNIIIINYLDKQINKLYKYIVI